MGASRRTAMATSTIILPLFLCICAVSPGHPAELPPSPDGLVYGLIPDTHLTLPAWEEPYTGPDIPLTLHAQTEPPFVPEQLALFPANREGSQLFLEWVVPGEGGGGEGLVAYGTDSAHLAHSAQCSPKSYTYGKGSVAEYTSGGIYCCVLGPLVAKTKYFYRVRGLQTLFNFTSLTRPGPQKYKFGLAADVGQTVNSSATFDHLAASEVDIVLFVGDLSYADNYGAPDCKPYGGGGGGRGGGVDLGWQTCGVGGVRWDSYGRLAQKVFAHTPVAYVAGNHELELNPAWGEVEAFKAYLARVPSMLDDRVNTFGSTRRMLHSSPASLSLAREWPALSPLFYSLLLGPLHVIALSSYSAFTTYSHQDYWLREELCLIDRALTPWLLVFAHTPLYNTDVSHYLEGEPMRFQFEPYFYNASVDLVVAGHVHAYERSHPVYDYQRDECGAVYVTVGDGGNDEGVAGPFLDPQPAYSAYREPSFGHAELAIESDTEATYTWFRNQDRNKIVSDSFKLENKFLKCGSKKPSFCA